MPAGSEVFRARCGSFLWTYLSFMARRQEAGVLGARFSGVMFVPRHCGVSTQRCLPIHTDFPSIFFNTMRYSYTEADNTGPRKLGLGTATLAAVFLMRFLLMCMDIESNPGPATGYGEEGDTRSQQVSNHLFDFNQCNFRPSTSICPPFSNAAPHTDTVTAGTTQQGTPDEALSRLQQVEQHYAALSTDMGALYAWCDSLQSENDLLKQNVARLTDRSQSLKSECDLLFDQQQQQSNAIDTLDRDVDKLEFFSKRKNVKFFNVAESPNEDYQTCTRKVVQLLNRFYPSKSWSCDDVERAHRVGPLREDFDRPRPLIACLHRWPDKLSVLQEKEYREDMADELGIRVATDLTSRQYNELRQHREEGRSAYFYKGQLCFKNRGYQGAKHRKNTKTPTPHRLLNHHEDNTKDTELTNKDSLLPPSPTDMEEFPSLPQPSRRQRKSQHAPLSPPRRCASPQPPQLSTQSEAQPQRLVSGDHSKDSVTPVTHSRLGASGSSLPKASEKSHLHKEFATTEAEKNNSSAWEKTTDSSMAFPAPQSSSTGNNPSSTHAPSGSPLSPESCMQPVTCQAIVHREDVPGSPEDQHVEQTSTDQNPQSPGQSYDIESQSPMTESFPPPLTDHSQPDPSLGGPVLRPQSPTAHDSPPARTESIDSVTKNAGDYGNLLLSTSITHENETTKPLPQRTPLTRKQAKNKNKQTRIKDKTIQTRLTDNCHPRDHTSTPISSSDK